MNNLKQSNPFKVPDQYFSQLEKNIIDRTVKANRRTIASWRPMMFAASFVLIIVVFGLVVLQNNRTALEAKREQVVYEKIYDLYLIEESNKPAIDADSISDFYSDDLFLVME
ncbi:hypothetical protein ACF3NR_03580 [Vaginella massiliensis]|uniref:hypothetical protein n=1 Tax=Vaginella massiliensis TaxID=1816680 RepID=UPI000838D6A2|nr:hypothetical protein [Vaginella massiliensis]